MTFNRVSSAAQSIRDDYLTLPGLSLTPDQARRLYCLDPVVCEGVLAALVDVRFLEQTGDGRYVRAGRPASGTGEGAARGRDNAPTVSRPAA